MRAKRPNMRICIRSPVTTIAFPMFAVLALIIKPADPPWIQNETTSPVTKVFVKRPTLITEYSSPLTTLIILPRVMYIDAAKRAGATRMKKF